MSSFHPTPDDGDQVRTADPAELAERVIDTGVAEEPTNRVSNTLTEVADDVALVESFSHMVVIKTDDGLVSFDASLAAHGEERLLAQSDRSVATYDSALLHVEHRGGAQRGVLEAPDLRNLAQVLLCFATAAVAASLLLGLGLGVVAPVVGLVHQGVGKRRRHVDAP